MRLPSIAAFAVLGLASSVTRERRVSHPLALACRGKTHGHWAAAIRRRRATSLQAGKVVCKKLARSSTFLSATFLHGSIHEILENSIYSSTHTGVSRVL